MTNTDFWNSIRSIISDGFNSEGLAKLERYADQFINGQLLFKRFSPREQHGCAEGGSSHVIATILSGAEDKTDPIPEEVIGFKGIFKQAARQTSWIEEWARKSGIWINDIDSYLSSNLGDIIAEGGEAKVYDNGSHLLKTIGLDYFILPIHALDRISLHNAYFPETRLEVIGFGRDGHDEFKILVSQPFIEGQEVSDAEILLYMKNMGFELKNPKNWTYATPDIYLSDMHDENIIKSRSGVYFVIDCDIRINTPDLRNGGTRVFTTEVMFSRGG